MNLSQKTYDINKMLCSYQSMWINITLSFCSIFFILFPTAVSYVHPTSDRHTHLPNMETVRIIIWKEIWLIRRGSQSTKIIFQGNKDGIWEQIWGISGSFMQVGYIIKVNGRQIQSWDTEVICKGTVEAVINRPFVVLRC